MQDINGQVAGYRDLVESLAQKHVGPNQAEFDDLVQEGLIAVWETLERGQIPAAEQIENVMKKWVRTLGYQIGKGIRRDGEEFEYAELLLLDDEVSESYVLGVDGIGRDFNVGPDLDY